MELIALLEAGIDFAEDDISVAPVEEILRRLDPIEQCARGAGFDVRLRQAGACGNHAGHRRPAQRRQKQPVQPAAGAGSRHRHRYPRHHARSGVGGGGDPRNPSQIRGHGRHSLRPGLVETLGIERSYQAMADADVTLVVLDLAAPIASRRSGADRTSQAAKGAGFWWEIRRICPAWLRRQEILSRFPRSLAKESGVCASRSRRMASSEQESGFITSIRHEQLLRESSRGAGAGSQSGRVRNPARDAAAGSLRGAAAPGCHYRRDHRG